jgi:hypothetical protein
MDHTQFCQCFVQHSYDILSGEKRQPNDHFIQAPS